MENKMNLHEHPEHFKDAVIAAAQYFGFSEVIIEKDYWITYILKNISNSVYKSNFVFKGGTSLSKAFKLIERFSEDIDLALIFPDNIKTDSQKKQFIKKLSKQITEGFPEIVIPGVTSKHGRFRKTAHEYNKNFSDSDSSTIRDKIIFELNSFTKPYPNLPKEINSIIAEFLIINNREELIGTYSLQPFSVNVLNIERTFVEKVVSLIRHSFSENPIDELREKIRHLYDLKILLDTETVMDFLNSVSFKEMIDAVKEDDKNNTQFNGSWVNSKWSDSILFSSTNDTWDKLYISYNSDLKQLVYGTFPSSEEIKHTLTVIGKRLISFGL